MTLALDTCDDVALADCVVDCVGDWDRDCDADGVGVSLGLPVPLGVDVELLVDEALALFAWLADDDGLAVEAAEGVVVTLPVAEGLGLDVWLAVCD